MKFTTHLATCAAVASACFLVPSLGYAQQVVPASCSGSGFVENFGAGAFTTALPAGASTTYNTYTNDGSVDDGEYVIGANQANR